MKPALILLALVAHLYCAEVPPEIVVGILKCESRSMFRDDGTVRYVDKKRGRHGERGCMQMKRIAFDQIKRKGEQFWMIEQDTRLAVDCAERYLRWLYEHSAHGDWDLAIQYYNAGPGNRSPAYLKRVRGSK